MAGKKSALRNICEPDLLNLGLAYTDEPDVIFRGITPAYAANCLAFLKASMSGTSAKIAVADSSPIPEMVKSLEQTKSVKSKRETSSVLYVF